MLSTPQSELSVTGSDANPTQKSLVSNFEFGCAYFASLGREFCFPLCHTKDYSLSNVRMPVWC